VGVISGVFWEAIAERILVRKVQGYRIILVEFWSRRRQLQFSTNLQLLGQCKNLSLGTHGSWKIVL